MKEKNPSHKKSEDKNPSLEKKKNTKKTVLVFSLLSIFFLACGFLISQQFFSQKKVEIVKTIEKQQTKKEPLPTENNKQDSSAKKLSFGDVFTVPSLSLNLENPVENRYIRVGIAIEYQGGKPQEDELKKREVQLKDIIISLVTKKTKNDLLTEEGKESLRRQIANKINEVMDQHIKSVFFTEFLVE